MDQEPDYGDLLFPGYDQRSVFRGLFKKNIYSDLLWLSQCTRDALLFLRMMEKYQQILFAFSIIRKNFISLRKLWSNGKCDFYNFISAVTLVDTFKVQPIQIDNNYSLLNNPCGVTTTRIRRERVERPLPSVSFLLQLTVTFFLFAFLKVDLKKN